MVNRSEEVDAAWAQVDAATTEMAQRVQALIDDINRTAAEGLTGPQTENTLNRLRSVVSFLNATGHNPVTPVPPIPPADEPMPAPFR